jgi:hypothetical protein
MPLAALTARCSLRQLRRARGAFPVAIRQRRILSTPCCRSVRAGGPSDIHAREADGNVVARRLKVLWSGAETVTPRKAKMDSTKLSVKVVSIAISE